MKRAVVACREMMKGENALCAGANEQTAWGCVNGEAVLLGAHPVFAFVFE